MIDYDREFYADSEKCKLTNMKNYLLHKQVKSQFESSKEGGKCKMCKKFYKGKLSNLKDHLLRKHKEKAEEIELVEATSATRNRNGMRFN